MTTSPSVVVLSGSLDPRSRTDQLALWCGRQCAATGAAATVFRGGDLEFPIFDPVRAERPAAVRRFLTALSTSDGVVLLSPAYHGALSGLLKNALDYVADLGSADRPYLDGRSLGLAVLAGGEQGAASALATLRAVGHALRAWPTPLGVTLCGDRAAFDLSGEPSHPDAVAQLRTMLAQVRLSRVPDVLSAPVVA
ncbi:NADPH-dependent FMN reductase [Umezawaea sp.]|uniref:NADPH-dependent FMN reductase n=1 Tax=Umezawaea sp. TaxID=1955258 RepID=UPI002ED3B787